MRQARFRGSIAANSITAAIAGSHARRLVSTIALMACILLTAAVGAYHRQPAASAPLTSPSIASRPGQTSGKSGRGLHSRLSHQPEADRVRRVLGQRFLSAGRERTVLVGTLTIGTDRSIVRIIRTQSDDGEQIEMAIDSGGSSMTWNPTEGARVDANRAVGTSRAIIERLALDSPDEFVLAQLRGASYSTVALRVMPKSAAGSEDYAGPTWDVVRVGEPDAGGPDATLSKARSFHINTSTGLIDRCFSQEDGETILAEISGWTDRLGEKVPTHITWTRNGQAIMELSLNSVSHGPKQ